MSIKFFLTIYLCAAMSGECVLPIQEPYIYPKSFDTFHECVRAGLSDSYEILYAEKFFTTDKLEEYRLYPSFICEEAKVALGPDT
jgi:hypothetical protein